MKLKNYKIYFNKLLKYADMCGVKVYHDKLEDSDGEYNPNNRSISLLSNGGEALEIAVFLHELGHFYDQMLDPKFNFSVTLNDAYKKISENKKLTKRQRVAILKCEKNAWSHGEAIANKLGIKLGKWFYAEKDRSMKIYEELSLGR